MTKYYLNISLNRILQALLFFTHKKGETMAKAIKPEDRGWNREKIDSTIIDFCRRHDATCTSCPGNVGAFEYKLIFMPNTWMKLSTTIAIAEWQSDSDVVITNITLQPPTERRRGYGSSIVRELISWAKENGWNEIRATQVVNPSSKQFWIKNGFVFAPEPNQTSDFILKIT